MQTFTHSNTCLNLIDVIVNMNDEDRISPITAFNSYSSKNRVDDELDEQKFASMGSVVTPKNLEFIPLLLDDRSHLPSEQQGK